MTAKFRVTYDVVTPESAELGDTAERGYASPGGWQHDDPADLDLRDALIAAGCHPYRRGPIGGWENGGRAFYQIDGVTDYRTGAETRYALHPPATITPSSYARLSRYLTGRSR